MAWRLLISGRMSTSHRTHSFSLFGVLGASYVSLVALLGLGAIVSGAEGMARGAVVLMLATVAMHFGRAAVVGTVRVLGVRRAHGLGADVRATLDVLGPDYRVTRVACEDVEREDHVVVGPTGAFVIVAADGDRGAGASHRRLFPEGRAWWRDMIEDCHIEALRAGERLRRGLGRPVVVHPILCLRHGLVTVGRVVRGVRIVHLQDLAHTITELPPSGEFDARQTERASEALTAVATVIPLRPRAQVEESASTDGARPR